MGRWKGDTFKEQIPEELVCSSAGMSRAMSKKFEFVNITGSADDECRDITDAMVATSHEWTDRAYAVTAQRGSQCSGIENQKPKE